MNRETRQRKREVGEFVPDPGAGGGKGGCPLHVEGEGPGGSRSATGENDETAEDRARARSRGVGTSATIAPGWVGRPEGRNTELAADRTQMGVAWGRHL